jgi:uncharacterized membrane protein
MDAKTKSIIAHITIIGWLIALILNNQNEGAKDEMTSFYLRQLLGLYLAGIILTFIPIIGWLASIVVLIFWIISLLGSLSGDMKKVPLLGDQFQEWFKGI